MCAGSRQRGEVEQERDVKLIQKLHLGINLLIGIVIFGSETSHHLRIIQLRYRKLILLTIV